MSLPEGFEVDAVPAGSLYHEGQVTPVTLVKVRVCLDQMTVTRYLDVAESRALAARILLQSDEAERSNRR